MLTWEHKCYENVPMTTKLGRKHIPVLVQDALAGLGQGLAQRRKAMHLTQPDLAIQAGVGLSTVVSLEKGHDGVSLGNLCKVLDALDMLGELEHLATAVHRPL
jgi:DNA-binding XRE family transcriptional regulator